MCLHDDLGFEGELDLDPPDEPGCSPDLGINPTLRGYGGVGEGAGILGGINTTWSQDFGYWEDALKRFVLLAW